MDWFEKSGRDRNYAQAIAAAMPLSGATSDALPQVIAAAPKASPRRLHLWEINAEFHCTLLGTCLSLSEQKGVLKKAGVSWGDLGSYGVHGLVIGCCAGKNVVSMRLDKLLERKYYREVREYSSCSVEEFAAGWVEHLALGDICGLYWTAFSRGDVPLDMLKQMFGDVHMLSHLNGGDNREYLQEAVRLREAGQKLARRLEQEKVTRRRSKNQIEELRKDLALSRQAAARAQRQLKNTGDAESLRETVAALQVRLDQDREVMSEQQRTIGALEKCNHDLDRDLKDTRHKNMQLQQAVERSCAAYEGLPPHCDESCPAFDLCARRILVVGGITKIAARYRKVIEGAGGEFDYHDGYMSGGNVALENQIGRSDIVLCPVDVNSHNACLSVKKICKRLNKTYRMLPGSSLSAISQALIDEHAVMQQ